MNTIEFLQISSAIVPDREALVEVGGSGARVTYGDMLPRVNKLATALQERGLEKGDKLAVMSVNSAEYVMTYYACALLGVTFVPLNYRSKNEELTHMINVSRAKAVLVSDRYVQLLDGIKPTLTGVQHFICYDGAREGYLDYN